MKVFSRTLLAANLLALLTGCTSVDTLYRSNMVADPICAGTISSPLRLNADNIEDENHPATKCAMQRHRVKGESGQHNEYMLQFLELSESGLPLPADGASRIAEIRSQLATSAKQNIVIAFVHGWRHDASVGDGDVRKFRTMLAYTASFLKERCKSSPTESRYCDTNLTGIYIGWRGRSFVDCELTICAVGAAPTLWSRTNVSEQIAPAVARFLNTIQSDSNVRSASRRNSFARDKLLVIGHSLGGNVLATGFEEAFVAQARRHTPGATAKPLAGDLMILINPASEAAKFTSIQQAVVERRAELGQDGMKAGYFPLEQKPVYISLTSACDWRDTPGKDIVRPIDCDTATNSLFPISRILAGARGEENTTAIGHLEPLANRRRGTTHELEINGQVGQRTSYLTALDPLLSQCLIADGWLRQARLRSRNNQFRGWDAGYKRPDRPDPLSALNMVNARLQHIGKNETHGGINAQFRHGNRRGADPFGYITSGSDPYWNVRSLDTGIASHNGYVSYPLWCAINQLWLDDVTGPFRGYARTRARIAENLN